MVFKNLSYHIILLTQNPPAAHCALRVKLKVLKMAYKALSNLISHHLLDLVLSHSPSHSPPATPSDTPAFALAVIFSFHFLV